MNECNDDWNLIARVVGLGTLIALLAISGGKLLDRYYPMYIHISTQTSQPHVTQQPTTPRN